MQKPFYSRNPKFFSKFTTRLYRFNFKKIAALFAIIIIIFLIISVAYKVMTPTINIYVSTTGNDQAIGDKAHPFKSISRAIQEITSITNNKNFSGSIDIYIKSGTYYLDNGLNIRSNLNPNSRCNIRFKPYSNILKKDNVIITGGIPLSPKLFQSANKSTNIIKSLSDSLSGKKILVYDLSKYNIKYDISKESILTAPELFVDNEPMTVARYPNDGFLLTEKASIKNLASNNEIYSFSADLDHINKWSKNDNIFMEGYWFHDWSDSTVRVSNIDNKNGTVNFTDRLPYGIKEGQRFFFLNILEELDSSSEYYIDYTKKLLYFMPKSNLNGNAISISVLNDPLLSIDSCNNITFSNLTFENSRNIGISIKNSSHINIDNCIIRNLSNTGIIINGGLDNIINNCTVYNTGTGGISVNGGDRNNLKSCEHVVENCDIYNFARIKRTYSAAININGVGVRSSNNKIYNSPHTAILFGGNEHIIEKNDIYDVAYETDDVGAIYSGRDWTYRGNIIRNNYLHDIGSKQEKIIKSGIYLDDCMSSAEIYGNRFNNINTAIYMGGGRDNIIRDNDISNCGRSIVFDDRGLTWQLDELFKRLDAVPYKDGIWAKKYPSLKNILKDGYAGTPKGNIIKNNKISQSKPIAISPSVKDNGEVKD